MALWSSSAQYKAAVSVVMWLLAIVSQNCLYQTIHVKELPGASIASLYFCTLKNIFSVKWGP